MENGNSRMPLGQNTSQAPSSTPPVVSPTALAQAEAIAGSTPKTPFYKNRKIIGMIFGVILVFLIIIVGLFFFSHKTEKQNLVSDSPKTWEIIVVYNPSTDILSLRKLTLLNKKITPDYRSAKFSQYSLNVIDANGKNLSSVKIPLATEIIDGNLLTTAYSSSSSTLKESPINNIFYAPHFDNEKHITITKNGKVILDMEVPTEKKNSFKFPSLEQAFAQNACTPLQVVFISDGYTDFDQFHKDVQSFEQTFIQTAPYSSKSPSMFDFKTVDNTQSLGCSTQGLVYCMQQSIPLMDQIARSQYPNYSKVVVIANAPASNPLDDGVAGISSGIGGSYAAFPNNFGSILSSTLIVARHELLGHAVGLLYDRYVATNPSYGLLLPGIKSNCTDNSSGEAFWSQAGITQTILGCGNKALYAPAEASCPAPQNHNLISGGTPASVMSAVGCGGPNFDPVEQAWITNNILPDYQGCVGDPTILTPAPVVSPTIYQIQYSITGSVFNDTNGNGTQDSGENGISGATLNLSGPVGGSKATDSSGNFSFDNLSNGTYSLILNYQGQSSSSVTIPLTNNRNQASVLFPVHTVGGQPPVINPVLTTPTPTIIAPQPTQGSEGGGSGGGDSGGSSGGEGGGGSPGPIFQPHGSPTPTPSQYYTCAPDPKCVSGQKNIQLCPLVCNPQ